MLFQFGLTFEIRVMKMKSSVIENQNISVKWDPDLVHTARHAKKVGNIGKIVLIFYFNKFFNSNIFYIKYMLEYYIIG